jgi:hypothetical protein
MQKCTFQTLGIKDIEGKSGEKTHPARQKLYAPRVFLNLFHRYGVTYGLYQVPLLLSFMLKN